MGLLKQVAILDRSVGLEGSDRNIMMQLCFWFSLGSIFVVHSWKYRVNLNFSILQPNLSFIRISLVVFYKFF